jgi:hypothetical protein
MRSIHVQLTLLTVPLVGVLASTLSASSRSSPILTTALSVKRCSSSSSSSRANCGRSGSRRVGRVNRGGTPVGRADVTKLDVRVHNRGISLLRFDILRFTRVPRASTTLDTRQRWVLVKRIVTIKPEHVRGIVVPDTQNENHSVSQGAAHLGQATLLSKHVAVLEYRLLVGAELVRDRVIVGAQSRNIDLGVLNNNTVLDIETTDLLQSSAGCTGGGMELSYDSDLLARIDLEARARSVVGLIAHAERVEVATRLVTDVTAVRTLGAPV